MQSATWPDWQHHAALTHLSITVTITVTITLYCYILPQCPIGCFVIVGGFGRGDPTGAPEFDQRGEDFPRITGIGIDIGARKTNTDYLDDVSTSYPDLQELAENNGMLAAQLSDRTAEFTGVPSQIQEGTQRGNPVYNDWYFMGGVTVAYRFRKKQPFADNR